MISYAKTDTRNREKIQSGFPVCIGSAGGTSSNLFIVADGMGGHKAGGFRIPVCRGTYERKYRKF